MSTKKRLIPALVASALAMGATGANAVTFSGVYVFGDSLSDSGYFRPFLTAIGVPSPLVATLGRFTTNPGPVWSELVANYYGGNAKPSNAGGGIYAQGGARVASASASTPPGSAQRPISTQIDEYLASTGGTADSNALFAVWGGANDILQAGAAGITPAATAEIQQIGRLKAAGARYILAFGLPNLGLTPSSQAGGAAAIAQGTAAAAGYNTLLFNGIASNNLRAIPVDTFSLLNEVVGNAAAYGFTNTTGFACTALPPFTTPTSVSSQFCSGGNLVSANAATTYVFADGIHPTTASHALLADFVKSLIDGPNAYSTMAEIPMASRAAHMRTLDDGLQAGQRAEVGKVTAFAAGDGGKYDIGTNALSPNTTSKNHSASVGVTFRASEGATIGIAAGKTTVSATMGSLGKFDTDESEVSVFGSLKGDGWYANFSGSVADLTFKNINRFVPIGIVTRVNTANTNGSSTSGNLTVGYDADWGNVTAGPFLSYTAQSVNVNGFTENASATTPLSTDLKMSDQTRTSRVASAGLRISANMGNWTPYARLSYDQENGLGSRFVTATPVTVQQNISYDIPAYLPPKHWSTGTIGVRAVFAQRVSVGLAWTSIFGRSELKQNGITGSVAIGF